MAYKSVIARDCKILICRFLVEEDLLREFLIELVLLEEFLVGRIFGK